MSDRILIIAARVNSIFMVIRGLIVRFFLVNESNPHHLKIGRGVKFHSLKRSNFSDDVTIGRFTWLNAVPSKGEYRGSLDIGKRSYIGNFCHFNFINSIVIGDDVMIADRVFMSDCSHDFSNPDVPISNQGIDFLGKVIIENGVWVGEGVCIMPGVHIGCNSVIASNSVVTKNVPSYSVVAGAPAKVLRNIGANLR